MNGLKCFSEPYQEKLQKLFLCIQRWIHNRVVTSALKISPDFKARSVNSSKALYIEFPEEEYAAVEKLKDGFLVCSIHLYDS